MNGIKVITGVLVAAALATWVIAATAKETGRMVVTNGRGSYSLTLHDAACHDREELRKAFPGAPQDAKLVVYDQTPVPLEVLGCYVIRGSEVFMRFLDGDALTEPMEKFRGV